MSTTLSFPISKMSSNSLADILSTTSAGLPLRSQAAKPSFKCPTMLSKPTRLNLVTVSSSLPSSVTSKIGWATSTIKEPTQGAKSPFKPILIDCGIKPL